MDKTLLTDDNIDDLITTACYGAIDYWCQGISSQEKSELLAEKPDAVMFFRVPDEDDVVFTLTNEHLRNAFFALLDLDQKHVNREIHGYFIGAYRDRDESGLDMGQIDATAADVCVQVAAFGEVVYG